MTSAVVSPSVVRCLGPTTRCYKHAMSTPRPALVLPSSSVVSRTEIGVVTRLFETPHVLLFARRNRKT